MEIKQHTHNKHVKEGIAENKKKYMVVKTKAQHVKIDEMK